MKVAYATSDGVTVDEHFEQCTRFDVYELDAGGAALVASHLLPDDEADDEADDEDTGPEGDRIEARVDLLRGCRILQVARIGGPAAARVVGAGIHPLVVAAGTSIQSLNDRLGTVLAGRPPRWLLR